MEDSEALTVSPGELKEQVLSPDESNVNIECIARQARSEKSKKVVPDFQIRSKRGPNRQHGLVVLERECLALREEVEHSSERQELLTILMECKMNMQKVAPEKYQEQNFEGLKELEEQKTREALELVQRKHKSVKWGGERERARMLQRLESSRVAGTVVRSPRQFLLLVRAHLPWLLTQTK